MDCTLIQRLFEILLAQPCARLVEPVLELSIRAKNCRVLLIFKHFIAIKRRPVCDEAWRKHVLVVHGAKGRHYQFTSRADHLGKFRKSDLAIDGKLLFEWEGDHFIGPVVPARPFTLVVPLHVKLLNIVAHLVKCKMLFLLLL